MKKILVNGAGGFIGGHLVKRLKNEGFWVRAVDLKSHEYFELPADEVVAAAAATAPVPCDTLLPCAVLHPHESTCAGASL